MAKKFLLIAQGVVLLVLCDNFFYPFIALVNSHVLWKFHVCHYSVFWVQIFTFSHSSHFCTNLLHPKLYVPKRMQPDLYLFYISCHVITNMSLY